MNKSRLVLVTLGIIFAGACLTLPVVLHTPRDYVSLSSEDPLSITQLSQKDPNDLPYQDGEDYLDSPTNRSRYLSKVKGVISSAVQERIGYLDESISQTHLMNRYYDRLTKCLSRRTNTSFQQKDVDNVMIKRHRVLSDLFILLKVRENLSKIEIPDEVAPQGEKYEEIDTQLNIENDRYQKVINRESDNHFLTSLKDLSNKLSKDTNRPSDSSDACRFKTETIQLSEAYTKVIDKQKADIARSKAIKESQAMLKPLKVLDDEALL